jgi:hypothetical protein
MSDITNPGCVNVADQANEGRGLSVDQAVLTGPSSNPSAATPAVAGGGLGGSTVTSTDPGLVNAADESSGGLPTNVNVPPIPG